MPGTTPNLLDGIATAKGRDDGTVWTVRSADGKRTVAELCVGKLYQRLNFKAAVADGIELPAPLTGRSASWAGGGVRIDDANVAAWRVVLDAVVGTVAAEAVEVTADDAAEASAEAVAAVEAATKRTGRTAKRQAV